MVAKVLFIKYNLKIVNYDPLEFKVVDKWTFTMGNRGPFCWT
jgi:hypothetical protein